MKNEETLFSLVCFGIKKKKSVNINLSLFYLKCLPQVFIAHLKKLHYTNWILAVALFAIYKYIFVLVFFLLNDTSLL